MSCGPAPQIPRSVLVVFPIDCEYSHSPAAVRCPILPFAPTAYTLPGPLPQTPCHEADVSSAFQFSPPAGPRSIGCAMSQAQPSSGNDIPVSVDMPMSLVSTGNTDGAQLPSIAPACT